MNVSLSRKNHIIALPQATWNASRSDDQSVTRPRQPIGDADAGSWGTGTALIASPQLLPQMNRTTSGVSQPSAAKSVAHTTSRKCQ